MVRLSLVNMYLHGFTDPHIYEYDTLTSEERWNEFADVILANPPFMSPKGGIKPHRRFSIQAKRSEVLFVDYMAEHLTPTGRAGIIVPEGIIFQSQTAYKDLRKMLVENSLVAVVSLPAGCFNPYSGRQDLHPHSRQIARPAERHHRFFQGGERRIRSWCPTPRDRQERPPSSQSRTRRLPSSAPQPAIPVDASATMGLIVPKEKIAANGDYNLSGERYRESGTKTNIFPLVTIEEVCSTSSGGTPLSGRTQYYEGGKIPWLRSGEVAQGEVFRSELFITEEGLKNSSAKIFAPNTVLVAMYGATAGEVGILRFEAATNQAVCGITPGERLRPDFLYLILKCNKSALIRFAGGGAQPNISQKIIREFQIPLPPLAVQKEIVAEIEGYQKVINGARAVLDNYRPHIRIDPDWPIVELADACEAILTGPFGTSLHQSDYVADGIPVINPQNIVDGAISTDGVKMVSCQTRDRLQEFCVRQNDIVIGRRGEMGRCAVATSEMNGWLCGTGCFVIRLSPQCDARFAFHQIASPKTKTYLEEQAVGVTRTS